MSPRCCWSAPKRRNRKLAIRAALGAGTSRIVRALLVESLVLGFVGGVLGLLLAYGGLRVLVAYAPAGLPRLDEIAIDARVLVFNLVISVLSGAVFGLIPAFRHASPQIAEAIGAGVRTARRQPRRPARANVLVVAQLALALVLLVSSGLMIRTFEAMRAVEPGFTQPDRLQGVSRRGPAAAGARARSGHDDSRHRPGQQAVGDRGRLLRRVRERAFHRGAAHQLGCAQPENHSYAANEVPRPAGLQERLPRLLPDHGNDGGRRPQLRLDRPPRSSDG